MKIAISVQAFLVYFIGFITAGGIFCLIMSDPLTLKLVLAWIVPGMLVALLLAVNRAAGKRSGQWQDND